MASIHLIDFSCFLYTFFFAYRHLSVDISGYKRPTGHLYGFHKFYSSIRNKFPEDTIIVVYDSFSKRRKDLMPSYKERERATEYPVHSDTNIIHSFSSIYGNIFYAKEEGYEADDLLYHLAKKYSESYDKVYVWSKDNDLIDVQFFPNVSIVRQFFVPLDPKEVSPYGLFNVQLYKVVFGDFSDKIKPLEHSRSLKKKDIIEYGKNHSVQEFLEDYKQGKFPAINSGQERDIEIRIEIFSHHYPDNGITVKPFPPITDEVIKTLIDLKLNSVLKYINSKGV